MFIAKNIKQKDQLTVITNSIENLLELSDVPGYDIISTGGVLRAGTMSLLGRRAAEGIGNYTVDKVFISCKAVDIDRGVTDGNDDVASIKQDMLAAGGKVYLAVDSTKFDKVAFARICPLSRVDVVITDRKPPEKWIKALEELHIECIYKK